MAPRLGVLSGLAVLSPRNAESHRHRHEDASPHLAASVTLSFASLAILSVFLTQRYLTVRVWSRLPYVLWLVFAVYADSFLFVFATAVLQFGFGVDSRESLCSAAIILCLVFYVSTKFIYLFLVEKVYIVRGSKKRRLRSKLYLFNAFGMIGVYLVVIALQFLFRFTRLEDEQCVIGINKVAMIPLIGFDGLVNVYLTILFLLPLSGLYSFQDPHKSHSRPRLRTIAVRTFVGSLCTLASSIVNLTVLMVLDGERAWLCLLCCNSDVLFSAVVIQWITSKDHAASAANNTAASSSATDSRTGGGGDHPPHPGCCCCQHRHHHRRRASSAAAANTDGGAEEEEEAASSAGTTTTTTAVPSSPPSSSSGGGRPRGTTPGPADSGQRSRSSTASTWVAAGDDADASAGALCKSLGV